MYPAEHEEAIEVPAYDSTGTIFQELEEEAASLEQQRRQLNDQRALLDLERTELEQQLSALQLQYALLDAPWAQCELQFLSLSTKCRNAFSCVEMSLENALLSFPLSMLSSLSGARNNQVENR